MAEYRATLLKSMLESFEQRVEPEAVRRISAGVEAEHFEVIRDAARSAWIDVRHWAVIDEQHLRVLGPLALAAHARE